MKCRDTGSYSTARTSVKKGINYFELCREIGSFRCNIHPDLAIHIRNRYTGVSPLEVYHKRLLNEKQEESQKSALMKKRRLEGRYLVRSVMHARKEGINGNQVDPQSWLKSRAFLHRTKRSSIPTYAYEVEERPDEGTSKTGGLGQTRGRRGTGLRRQSLTNEGDGESSSRRQKHTEKIYKSQLGKLNVDSLFSSSTANSSQVPRKPHDRTASKTCLQLYQAYQADSSSRPRQNRITPYLDPCGAPSRRAKVQVDTGHNSARSCIRQPARPQLSPTRLSKGHRALITRQRAHLLYAPDCHSANPSQEGQQIVRQYEEGVSSEYLATGNDVSAHQNVSRHIKSLSWKSPSPQVPSAVASNCQPKSDKENHDHICNLELDVKPLKDVFTFQEQSDILFRGNLSAEEIHCYFVALHQKARQMMQQIEDNHLVSSSPKPHPQKTITTIKDDDHNDNL